MADEADVANDYLEVAMLRALNQRQTVPGKKTGTQECQDCGEKIPAERRKLGFQLCIECAAESERRKSRFADY